MKGQSSVVQFHLIQTWIQLLTNKQMKQGWQNDSLIKLITNASNRGSEIYWPGSIWRISQSVFRWFSNRKCPLEYSNYLFKIYTYAYNWAATVMPHSRFNTLQNTENTDKLFSYVLTCIFISDMQFKCDWTKTESRQNNDQYFIRQILKVFYV